MQLTLRTTALGHLSSSFVSLTRQNVRVVAILRLSFTMQTRLALNSQSYRTLPPEPPQLAPRWFAFPQQLRTLNIFMCLLVVSMSFDSCLFNIFIDIYSSPVSLAADPLSDDQLAKMALLSCQVFFLAITSFAGQSYLILCCPFIFQKVPILPCTQRQGESDRKVSSGEKCLMFLESLWLTVERAHTSEQVRLKSGFPQYFCLCCFSCKGTDFSQPVLLPPSSFHN